MHNFGHLLVQAFLAFGVFAILFYFFINSYYLLIHVLALLKLHTDVRESRRNPPFQEFTTPFYPGVGIVVPAYNEEENIVENVQSLLSLNYPDVEIVVVNDGSTDRTLSRLREQFDLAPVDANIPFEIPSEPIQDVYRSCRYEDLLVVDKENGSKSDALNAGIWLTEKPLFCAVDADTVIARDTLSQVVRPFLEYPATAVAAGGVVRVANRCDVEDGMIRRVRLPKTGLQGLQVMEYLRAFYSGRLGLSRINGLILISGAFGVFRTDVVREIGGYRHDTVTEDFDLVIRLHRHLCDADREYMVDFLPEPIAWTEVPETLGSLGEQRRRWYRGMIETIATNWRMLLNPSYGNVGLIILPVYAAVEVFGRLVEGLGYVFLPLAWYFGIINFELFLVFFFLTSGFGVVLSWFGVFSEVYSFNRYDSPWQVLRLLWYGVIENFGYRQWRTIVAWHGLVQYLLPGEQQWWDMERSGLSVDE